MSVKLIYSTPLWIISNGIRYSHDNHEKSDTPIINDKVKDKDIVCPLCGGSQCGFDFDDSFGCSECGYESRYDYFINRKDFELIKRVGMKLKHESVLEHSLIVFEIEASRALLQELSRHRIGVSATVKSTRYTLKELKNEHTFLAGLEKSMERAKKYVVLTGDRITDEYIVDNLENLRQLVANNKPNDIAKYALPEAFKFKGQYSFNLRSLIHLLELRTTKEALWEFQKLSKEIIDELPEDYREIVLENDKIKKNYERLSNI